MEIHKKGLDNDYLTVLKSSKIHVFDLPEEYTFSTGSSENKQRLPLRHFEDMKNGVITAQILASDGGAAGCFRSRRILLAERALLPPLGQKLSPLHSPSSSSRTLGNLRCFSGDKQSNLRLFRAGELPTKTSVDRILDMFNFEKTSRKW